MVLEQTKHCQKNFCYDCQKEIKVEGKEIKNGVFLVYKNGEEKINIFKCQECFDKSKELRNYQACEVYSRIVGYLRPVNQWNPGKQAEFKDRKNYKLKN